MTSGPFPLHRFPLFRSRDVHSFTTHLNGAYYPADVQPEATSSFTAASVVNVLHTPDFTLGYIRPGGGVRFTPDVQFTSYHVNLLLSGSALAVSGHEEVRLEPGFAAVHTARQRHRVQIRGGSELIGLKLSRELVEGELGAMLGRPVGDPVRFAAGFDLRTGAGRSWLSLARLFLDEVDRPGLLDDPAVRRQYVRTLVTALLSAQPHSYSEALHADRAPLRPRTVRRAQEFIHEHFAEPLTVTDIAAAAGSSVRRLQEAFAAHLARTPMNYLRDVRLDASRQRLAAGECSVTDAAHQCGFAHLGRYSAAYRERFGELPSETATGRGAASR